MTIKELNEKIEQLYWEADLFSMDDDMRYLVAKILDEIVELEEYRRLLLSQDTIIE